MFLPTTKTLLNAVTAPTASPGLHDPEFRLKDYVRDEVLLAVTGTAATLSLQPQWSLDGAAWYDLGAALTAKGLTVVAGVKAPFFRVNLTAVSGGTLTVKAR